MQQRRRAIDRADWVASGARAALAMCAEDMGTPFAAMLDALPRNPIVLARFFKASASELQRRRTDANRCAHEPRATDHRERRSWERAGQVLATKLVFPTFDDGIASANARGGPQ